MSVRVMEAVMQDCTTTGVERLVLLIMASDADDDGRNCFRGPASLAKRANCSRDWVKKIVRRLRETGQIVPEGSSKYGTTVYRIALAEGGSDQTPGPIGPRGSISTRGGVRSAPKPGSDRTPNSTTNTSARRERARARDFSHLDAKVIG